MSVVAIDDKATPPSGYPALYRIVARGRLEALWSDRLGGLRLTVARRVVEGTITILDVWLPGPGQLSELLNTLYELHLPILEVKKVGEEERT